MTCSKISELAEPYAAANCTKTTEPWKWRTHPNPKL
jgi:hypothetical protein